MPPKHLALGASILTVAFVMASTAEAQQNLPTIDVGGQRLRNGRTSRPATAPTVSGSSAPAEPVSGVGVAGGQGVGDDAQPALFTPGGGSLVAPSIPAVRAKLKRNVGSVAFVDANTREQQKRYIADLATL